MEIKIIAEASTELERQTIGWGLSFLIDNDLLFDTFSNENVLKKNFSNLGIDVKSLKYVVISHEHWDHTGGLCYILKENPKVKVFICKNFSHEFKLKLRDFNVDFIEVEGPLEIKDNIFTSGEIMGKYNHEDLPEQALVIKKGDLTVITGCAHPGITRILKEVIKTFSLPIALVLGGFHLYDKQEIEVERIIEEFKEIGVERVAPCHCTGEKATRLFQREYKGNFISIYSGVGIDV